MVRCPAHPLTPLPILTFLYSFRAVSAAVQQGTIDDETGDSFSGVRPIYFPAQSWYQGARCSVNCQRHSSLNNSLAFSGTWHAPLRDATRSTSGVYFHFLGTALSVQYILPNPSLPIRSHPSPQYTLQFILDDVKLTENFTHVSDSSDSFQYNVSVFSIANLPNKKHSFTILSTSNVDGSSPLFDYAMYLFSSEENITTLTKRADDPNSKNQLPLILGVVLGALFFAVIIIWAVWYHLRWRRRQRLTTRRPNKTPSRFTIDPFIPTHRNRRYLVTEIIRSPLAATSQGMALDQVKLQAVEEGVGTVVGVEVSHTAKQDHHQQRRHRCSLPLAASRHKRTLL
ncbi:hypothetical protein PM082_022926 [Marasmius tenuissimus]|nr:hypothetical protein PM082_022926 [Marasmius tenuissimus]